MKTCSTRPVNFEQETGYRYPEKSSQILSDFALIIET